MVAFFSSCAGLAFLHRLILAVHFVFGLLALGSSRHIETFLRLSGLSAFVASSKTTANKTQRQILSVINDFEHEQRASLAGRMRADLGGDVRDISMSADETFHPQICLVAIEPVTNFILLETYAPDRKAPTWILTAREALRDMPVQVVQVVADGAGALAAMAQHFGAHLSPDLMHILQPTVQSVLSAATRKAEAATGADADRLAGELERLREALREIREGYHPVDLASGQLMTTAMSTARVEAGFETIDSVIEEMELSDKSRKGLSKSKRRVDEMILTLGRAEVGEEQSHRGPI